MALSKQNPVIFVYTAANSGLTPASFVALAVPVNCTVYMLKNSGPDILYMRSDSANVSTEDTMSAGFFEDIMPLASLGNSARYLAGDILYYVKCTGPLVGKFWY